MAEQIELASFEKYLQALTTLGPRMTSAVLDNAMNKESFENHDDVKFVAQMICKTFKIPEANIYHGVGRKDDRGLAVCFCCYYLSKVLGHEVDVVAHMLKKSVWTVYKSANAIDQLKPTHPRDKKYHEWKQNIFDKKVAAYQQGKIATAKTTKNGKDQQ